MNRREFLAAGAAGSSALARPHVVLILADDLGWRDVGYQGSEMQTPHIDGLAAQGVRFTNLYAYPLCTPTRAGLMTGRSPARYGLIYSVVRPWSPYGLPLDEHAMPETFQALGYQTAMAGKWHLGHAHRRMLPNARGFDHFYGFLYADIDYYQHTHLSGLDWQRNGTGVREQGPTAASRTDRCEAAR
ncbi:MAG: sulfatase-like hydrolase/transferase [Acidobacteria bacterium]|nr:sulfatase-like hydrolase/transferase [Acidobacteriota bacterium]